MRPNGPTMKSRVECGGHDKRKEKTRAAGKGTDKGAEGRIIKIKNRKKIRREKEKGKGLWPKSLSPFFMAKLTRGPLTVYNRGINAKPCGLEERR
ncbi:MAG: hypothetical protein IIZ39_05550 [Blautia sp.]|nr:hypothetical protein [Blautia sp.]